MSSEQNQIVVKEPRTVKDYLALPAYKDRFTEVLNKRAPQFMAAITAVSQMPGLKDADPRSVIAGAMVAATLDLPVNPTLGQAHIVAYKNQQGESIAQFQIGYKGLIQLALRSGQYRRLNAGPVNAEVFTGYDMVGEPSLDWSKFDPTKDVGGYFCAFELVNGFTKVVYWSKAQVDAHGKRFSKAYQKGYKSSPWFSDFDGMATKTVIKNALTKWGMLSVEMQKAVVHDQGAQTDVDADVKYVDGEDRTADAVEGDPAPDRPAPKPRSPKGAALVKDNPKPVEIVVPAEPEAVPEPPKPANPLHAEGEKIIAEANEKVAEVLGRAASDHARSVVAGASAASTGSRAATEAMINEAVAQGMPEKGVTLPQRPRLNDGKIITVEAQVDKFKRAAGLKDGKQITYIAAEIVSPEFKGTVADLSASPLWTLDEPLRLTLRGGPKRVFVDKIEAIVEAPAAAQQETTDEF